MADEQTFFGRVKAPVAGFIKRHFPERHIIFKDHRRVVCLKVRTTHQLIAAGGLLGCMIWAFLATAAFLHGATQLASRDQEIAARAAEIDDMKNNYQAAFGKLDEFQTIFSGITCEITDIQDSLLRITEKSVTNSRRAAAGMPRLDPDANKCRSDGRIQLAALPMVEGQADSFRPVGQADSFRPVGQADSFRPVGQADTPRISGPLPDGGEALRQTARLEPAASDSDTLQRRVNQLTGELDRLRESHGAFLRHSADLTALRIGELEKTLASVGVNTTAAVAMIGDGHFGRGGPFIAAPLRGAALPAGALPDDFNPISLFNSHADRLDSLANVLKSLPLASPLADYEMTSPFGSRNDPINAMTGIHEGVDLGASSGTPVSATGDGQIVWAGWRDRYGNMVEIDHGNGLKTRYAHLSKILVQLGAHVGRGAVVGLVGETGRTTGPHLHYEVRLTDQATNPMKFIAAGQNVLKTQ